MIVTVFGGSKCTDEVAVMAEELGRRLAQAGHTVVTGGYDGVMSALSKGARQAGGEVVGVVLKGIGAPNEFVNDTRVMDNYWNRLAGLMEEGDAYVVLPGGSGTSAELLVALHTQANWEKLMPPGTPKKKVILLNPNYVERVKILDGLCKLVGEEVAGFLLQATAPEGVAALLKGE